jgi:flavin reductase (DIM6/NTAB) family NADH-FMN oxidoreductase RutF
MVTRMRSALRRLLFGSEALPQEFTVAMRAPQTEVAVRLLGLKEALDVTNRHAMACADPLTICVSIDENTPVRPEQLTALSLEYVSRDTPSRLLGRIRLQPSGVEHRVDGARLILFEPRSSSNYCLSPLQLFLHYLLYFWRRRKQSGAADLHMSFLEERAAMVMFIRPHPVALGSAQGKNRGNIFTMNIMGEAGDRHFTFALKDSRTPAHLVEELGRVAVSNVPFSRGPLAFQLAANHTKNSVEWDQLPFSCRPSGTFGFPVPVFATRVRELQVEKVLRIGSHTFFVGAVVNDEIRSDEAELCVVHGFYQAWRIKRGIAEKEPSVRADAVNKRRGYAAQSAGR